MRKCVSRRLLALSEGEIATLTTSMRQIGVGTPGGAEALAIFHQFLFDEGMTGSLSGPLARIKVDEKNCFGMIVWKAVREAASRFLPKHKAAAAWNIGVCPTLNKKGSHQCRRIRVQSKETSMARWSAAWLWEWWQQKREEALPRLAAGTLLPWIGVDDPSEEQRLQADHSAIFQLGGPEKHTTAHDPQHALQQNEGLADLWYMDDCDISMAAIMITNRSFFLFVTQNSGNA